MTNEEIKEEFRKQFPQFEGLGAQFPIFKETPVYTHVIQFIERALENKDKAHQEELEKVVERTYARLEDEVRALKRRADSSTYLYGQGESNAYEQVLKLLTPIKTDK